MLGMPWPHPFGIGAWLFPYKHAPAPHVLPVTTPNFIALDQIGFIILMGHKNFGDAGAPWDGDVADPLEICYSSICVVVPNLVILGQTVRV